MIHLTTKQSASNCVTLKTSGEVWYFLFCDSSDHETKCIKLCDAENVGRGVVFYCSVIHLTTKQSASNCVALKTSGEVWYFLFCDPSDHETKCIKLCDAENLGRGVVFYCSVIHLTTKQSASNCVTLKTSGEVWYFLFCDPSDHETKCIKLCDAENLGRGVVFYCSVIHLTTKQSASNCVTLKTSGEVWYFIVL